MKISRAVIVKRDQASSHGSRLVSSAAAPVDCTEIGARAKIIPAVIVEARETARSIVRAAECEAEEIRQRAVVEATDVSLQQQARARADALSLVVRQALELRKRQADLDESVLDRSVALARMLAERLLGEQLTLKPERIAALARQTLGEAAGARQAVITAHPDDARLLEAGLESMETLLEALTIEADATLARGQLRVETELGVVEADVPGQLERLSSQLRQLLQGRD